MNTATMNPATGMHIPKAQNEPTMIAQLTERRAQLLVELRDIEQALEQLTANPNFEAIMRTILRAAHKLY